MFKLTPFFTLILNLCLLSGCSTINPKAHIGAKRLASYQNDYRALANTAWSPIESKRVISLKQQSPHIPEIRQRLIKLHDVKNYQPSNPKYYDNTLKGGVQRFQHRHGLKADGIIGKTTLEQLNISPIKC